MKQKILLIDDDPLVVKTIKKLVEREDYVIDIAKDANEGLKKGKENDFQLIICDIRMPEINGIQLIKKLREFYRNENKTQIPVIFITGYANEDAPEEALKLGAKDYILKPFDIDKLLNSIKSNLA